MKLKTSESEFNELPVLNQLFLAEWKLRKGYTPSKECDFGQLVELALALTNDLRFETPSEHTTFNNSLQYDEILIAWEGGEPISILFFELNKKLRRRINQYIVVNSK